MNTATATATATATVTVTVTVTVTDTNTDLVDNQQMLADSAIKYLERGYGDAVRGARDEVSRGRCHDDDIGILEVTGDDDLGLRLELPEHDLGVDEIFRTPEGDHSHATDKAGW